MDFQLVNKQKKYTFIPAVIGIFSMFLPFVSFGGILSITAINYGGVAYWVLVGFLLPVIACLIGDKTQPLSKLFWIITLLSGCLSALVLIFSFFQNIDVVQFICFGYYLCILSSFAVLYFAWTYRDYGAPVDLYHESYDQLERKDDKIMDGLEAKDQDNPEN